MWGGRGEVFVPTNGAASDEMGWRCLALSHSPVSND